MKSTKMKIVVEAEVPDGATHYTWHRNRFTWIRFKNNKPQYWHVSDSTWEYFINSTDIKPIEVIE